MIIDTYMIMNQLNETSYNIHVLAMIIDTYMILNQLNETSYNIPLQLYCHSHAAEIQ